MLVVTSDGDTLSVVEVCDVHCDVDAVVVVDAVDVCNVSVGRQLIKSTSESDTPLEVTLSDDDDAVVVVFVMATFVIGDDDDDDEVIGVVVVRAMESEEEEEEVATVVVMYAAEDIETVA